MPAKKARKQEKYELHKKTWSRRYCLEQLDSMDENVTLTDSGISRTHCDCFFCYKEVRGVRIGGAVTWIASTTTVSPCTHLVFCSRMRVRDNGSFVKMSDPMTYFQIFCPLSQDCTPLWRVAFPRFLLIPRKLGCPPLCSLCNGNINAPWQWKEQRKAHISIQRMRLLLSKVVTKTLHKKKDQWELEKEIVGNLCQQWHYSRSSWRWAASGMQAEVVLPYHQ